MDLFDTADRRLYLTSEERRAFLEAAPREVRTFCLILHYTGCRISESLALTLESFDFSGRAVIFETLKKRRRGHLQNFFEKPDDFLTSQIFSPPPFFYILKLLRLFRYRKFLKNLQNNALNVCFSELYMSS